MSAREPVSVEEIREALSACGGRVAPAARLLGLARNNLYKRLASSGMRPDEFRGGLVREVRVSAPATRAKPLRVARSVYLRPDQIKALDDACLDLPAVLREKLSPSKVLEKLIDDCFADWLREKLAHAPAKGTAVRCSGPAGAFR